MRKSGVFKVCPVCKKEFYVKKCSAKERIYCSKPCYTITMKGKPFCVENQFKKGHKTWNAGTKGLMKSNEQSFKKGKDHKLFKEITYHQRYRHVYIPDHPFCDRHGRVKEHRYLMEQHIGRYLSPKETIHHVNHIRDDNRIENLLLCKSRNDHSKLHSPSDETRIKMSLAKIGKAPWNKGLKFKN